MHIPNIASLLPSLVGGVVNAFAEPGDCNGACQNIRDPGVIQRTDGKYFRFSTSEKILTASANSLEGPWTAHGSAIKNGSIIDLPGRNLLWVSYLSPSPASKFRPFPSIIFCCLTYVDVTTSSFLFPLLYSRVYLTMLWDSGADQRFMHEDASETFTLLCRDAANQPCLRRIGS